MLNKTTAHWNLVMKALNLIDKWLYKHLSRNDLPIKDQNFTILCIKVIYSMKPVPNVKMLIIIVISQSGIRKAVRHARMAHKATKWPIKKILTGPVMRPDRTKLVK